MRNLVCEQPKTLRPLDRAAVIIGLYTMHYNKCVYGIHIIICVIYIYRSVL
jgi:hypothetical protein